MLLDIDLVSIMLIVVVVMLIVLFYVYLGLNITLWHSQFNTSLFILMTCFPPFPSQL